ncbi:MAG: M1 family aminopeptidase [Nitrososphaerota archaeon]|nr:M1 family aminopeptidase [Candidatus Calditenuaceae archaeon]MDW8073659.1 M1 family aminopeptidase [Nitrososphaerota archaeon]
MSTVYPYYKPGRGFTYPEYSSRFQPSNNFRVKHLKLELWIDFEGETLRGVEEVDVEHGLGGGWILLDACEMWIDGVRVDGREAEWRYDGERLSVKLDSGRGRIQIAYRAKPRKGFHFVKPDKANPGRSPQAWSQGETDYNRFWLPLVDHPSQKYTSEIIAYVPPGFVAVSNGDLVSKGSRGGWDYWHWRMDKPHSPYLISVVAGVFEEYSENFNDVRLSYYVPPGYGRVYRLSFEKTPEILEFFSNYLDYPYPYNKYAQVAVYEFIFGGMENTTATTLTELTLHDEKAHIDFSSDPLVAHEAAHQWFGDLVTCRDWPHIWINESFATLLENLFVRHDKGEDEFVYELVRDMDAYLREYRDYYARPIVTRVYRYPAELFDAHSYPKGGLILNMLRAMLGEDVFRRGLNLFLRRFAYSVADTEDFRKVMEESSGRNLELFFEQFFYNAGHPSIKVEEEWRESSRQLLLRFKQTQGDDSLPVYHLELPVGIKTKSAERKLTVELREREVTHVIALDEAPELICIDPNFEVFKTLEHGRGVEQHIKVLEADEHVYCRVLAVRALGRLGGAKAVEALKKSVLGDRFWGVAAEAARALGELRTEEAKKALLEALGSVTHAKVRRAICDALGSFRGDDVVEALSKVLSDSEESYYVRQAAAVSLGKTKNERVHEVLLKHIDTPSHASAITVGVLRGLAELGGENSLKILLRYSEPDRQTPVRAAAVASLGRFPGRREVVEALRYYARDSNYRVRQAVIAACRELLSSEVVGILEDVAQNDVYEMNRRAARDAAEKVRRSLERGVEYKELREELERIKEENRRLVERVSVLAGAIESKA